MGSISKMIPICRDIASYFETASKNLTRLEEINLSQDRSMTLVFTTWKPSGSVGTKYDVGCGRLRASPNLTADSDESRTMPAPNPFPASQQAPSQPVPALNLFPLNDSFIPKHIHLNQRVKIGRQTNAKTVPGERNGYFDSKVLSRQHAEVWEENGKVCRYQDNCKIRSDEARPDLHQGRQELKRDVYQRRKTLPRECRVGTV